MSVGVFSEINNLKNRIYGRLLHRNVDLLICLVPYITTRSWRRNARTNGVTFVTRRLLYNHRYTRRLRFIFLSRTSYVFLDGIPVRIIDCRCKIKKWFFFRPSGRQIAPKTLIMHLISVVSNRKRLIPSGNTIAHWIIVYPDKLTNASVDFCFYINFCCRSILMLTRMELFPTIPYITLLFTLLIILL